MTADELAGRLEEGRVQLLDVRSREEYDGEAGYPCDPRQGHIEGAVHLDWQELQGLDTDRVRALLEERGIDPARPIVAYCHSGQRSSLAAALLHAAGVEHVENYDGSWHEWSRR